MFTTSCYVHKNTPELRKELEKLGYHREELWEESDNHEPYLAVDNESSEYYTLDDYVLSKDQGGWGIDCGDSEDLFLALASLRDDSDRFQWFTTDDINPAWEREGDLDYSGFLLQSVRRWRKATFEEIMMHYENIRTTNTD